MGGSDESRDLTNQPVLVLEKSRRPMVIGL